MKRFVSLLAVAIAVVSSVRADAAFVTAITAGAGQNIGGNLAANWTVDNGSGVVQNGILSPVSPEGAGPRIINISVTVLKKFSPFNIQIATRALGGTPAGVDQFYRLNITVTNGLTYSNSAHNLMNGFDFEDVSESGNGISTFNHGSPAPNPGVFALQIPVPGTPNLAGPTPTTPGWRFGGLNGGGPTLAPGGSTTVSLTLRVNQNVSPLGTINRTSNFSITANPEPATLLLAGLVLVPGGLVIRRRRKAAQMLEETSTIA